MNRLTSYNILILITAILMLPTFAKAEGGCFVSPITARDKDSIPYTGIELGCEGYKKNKSLIGGSGSLLFLHPEERKYDSGFLGINFEITKNFIYKPIKNYKAFTPYFGFGTIVAFHANKITEGEIEYNQISDISMHSFTPNIGVRFPITNKFTLIPKLRYIMTLNKDNSPLVSIGILFHYNFDNRE